MAVFALVHGGWHGAWCWEQLTPHLQRRGHGVVTMDLPCEDPAATFDTYADVVCAALDDRGGDIVLVGHSLGGLTIPLVAARRPVSHLVYLCALLPCVGQSWVDQVRADPDMVQPEWDAGLQPDGPGRTRWFDPGLARALLFADCDEATATAAFHRLRPQVGLGALPFPLPELPRVPTTAVICTEDRMVNPAWSRRAVAQRFGVSAIELPGGHSPFFSRPAELAEVLVSCAARPPEPAAPAT